MSNLICDSALTEEQKDQLRVAHAGVLVRVSQHGCDKRDGDHLHDRKLTETRRLPEPAPPDVAPDEDRSDDAAQDTWQILIDEPF